MSFNHSFHFYSRALTVAGAVLFSLGSFAQEMPKPELIVEVPEHVFAPVGFDDNDNAQVVMSGEFMSTCFKLAPAKVTVDQAKKKVFLRNQAYYTDSSWCVRVPSPYVQTVDLGALPRGEYQVLVQGRNGKFASRTKLVVAATKKPNSPFGTDDQLYAVAEDVKLKKDAQNRPVEFTLSGQLTSTCIFLVGIEVRHDQPDTVEVLPITEQRGEDCQRWLTPFTKPFAIPEGLKDHTLVHVRSLNGQSVNRVYEF